MFAKNFMMKGKFGAILFIFFSSLTFAQTINDIKGKWELKDVIVPSDMDEESKAMLIGFSTGTTFEFGENSAYSSSFMGKTDSGSWTLLPKKIEINSGTGEIYLMEIVEYKANFLSVKIRKAAFTMTRTSSTASSIAPTEIPVYTSALKEQITKRWFLKRKTTDKDLSPELKDLAERFFENSIREYRADGTYYVKLGSIEQEGTWKFTEDKTGVIMECEGYKKIWNILSITNSELIMVMGKDKDKWIFSTQE